VGKIIDAGVDYEAILEAADDDPDGCDVMLWDGGNHAFSFYEPDLAITVLDPHRPGQELRYYPGEVCLRTADVSIINKIDSASQESIDIVEQNFKTVNLNSEIIIEKSDILVDKQEIIKGKKVLVVEDGPKLTHGEMRLEEVTVAAQRSAAKEIVN